MAHFGKVLKQLRQSLTGLTQTEFGRKAGMSLPTISNWERSATPPANHGHSYQRVAKALGMAPEELTRRWQGGWIQVDLTGELATRIEAEAKRQGLSPSDLVGRILGEALDVPAQADAATADQPVRGVVLDRTRRTAEEPVIAVDTEVAAPRKKRRRPGRPQRSRSAAVHA